MFWRGEDALPLFLVHDYLEVYPNCSSAFCGIRRTRVPIPLLYVKNIIILVAAVSVFFSLARWMDGCGGREVASDIFADGQ